MSRVDSIRGQKGFSFIELLVAMSLMAILLGLAGPNFSQMAATYRLLGTANELAFQIGRARLQAIGQNTWVKVEAVGTTGYQCTASATNSDFAPLEGTMVEFPHGVTAEETNGPLVFDRLGLANTSGFSITITSGGGTRTVKVNKLGRVTVSG